VVSVMNIWFRRMLENFWIDKRMRITKTDSAPKGLMVGESVGR
jgi:hypothetical protein